MKPAFLKKIPHFKFLRDIFIFALFITLLHFWQTRKLVESDESLIPYLHLQTLSGEVFNPHKLKGKKTLVYSFAPWCGICNVTSAAVFKIANAYNENFHVIAVAYSFEDILSLHAYRSNHKFNFPLLLGTERAAELMGIHSFPTFYILNDQGAVEYKTIGYTSYLGLYIRLWL